MWLIRTQLMDLRSSVLHNIDSSEPARRHAARLRVPAFTLYFMCVRLGAGNPAAQRCWEFYQVLQRYRVVDRACDLMLMFIDEYYDADDFDFLVRCRAAVLEGESRDASDLSAIHVPTGS